MFRKEDFTFVYEGLLKETEPSFEVYDFPIKEEDITGIYPPMFSPEHKGEWLAAVDIAVADPRLKATFVYAPCDGVVTAGVLTNDKWGVEDKHKRFLNWINIAVKGDEFYELAHIAAVPNNILKVGQTVKKGEIIARVALNGRITVSNGMPDAHLHMFVGRWTGKGKFEGRRIRWNEEKILV